MINNLNNADPEVRKISVLKLGKIKSIHAVMPLIRQIYRERYLYLYKKEYKKYLIDYYFDALKEIGPQITYYLIPELLSCPDDLFLKFYNLLKSFKINSFHMLNFSLTPDEDPFYICEIITFWTLLRERDAFKKVSKFLIHSDCEVKRVATIYFLQFGKEGAEFLKNCLFQNKNLSEIDFGKLNSFQIEVLNEIKKIFKDIN
ncbi:MAG: hypothetical protein ACTSRZ_00080 [Promethearchaeota archaeon]